MEKVQNPVNIHELVDAFQNQSDSIMWYVNRVTGGVMMLTSEEARYVEDGDIAEEGFLESLPAWQRPLVLQTKEILESDHYVPIPSRWDINRYEIMEDFCHSIEDEEMQDGLFRAIQGSGAFGRFKTAVHCFKIEKDWYRFEYDRLKEKAIKWCKEEGIAFRENSSGATKSFSLQPSSLSL